MPKKNKKEKSLEENALNNDVEIAEAIEPDTVKKAVDVTNKNVKSGTVLCNFRADRFYKIGDVYEGENSEEFREQGLIA